MRRRSKYHSHAITFVNLIGSEIGIGRGLQDVIATANVKETVAGRATSTTGATGTIVAMVIDILRATVHVLLLQLPENLKWPGNNSPAICCRALFVHLHQRQRS